MKPMNLARLLVLFIGCMSCATICLMTAAGEDIPFYIWGMFGGSLSEFGIEGINILRKR